MPEEREEIPWAVMACILSVTRLCAPSSELQIAESWYGKTALDDLLGVPEETINDDRLYRALDALLPHKDALCKHLQDRCGELFGETVDSLFYDMRPASHVSCDDPDDDRLPDRIGVILGSTPRSCIHPPACNPRQKRGGVIGE